MPQQPETLIESVVYLALAIGFGFPWCLGMHQLLVDLIDWLQEQRRRQ